MTDQTASKRWVSAENFVSVTKMVDSYNKKAIAAGIEPAQIKNVVKRMAKLIYLGDSLEEAKTKNQAFTVDILAPTPEGYNTFEGLVSQVNFELVYPAITLDSWQMVARIKSEAAGNLIVSKIPHSEIPERFKTRGDHCDHCQTSRNRRFTYLLKKYGGEMKQVGGTCLRDFTNDAYALDKAKMLELETELTEKVEAMPPFVVSNLMLKPLVIDLENYLVHVACAIRENGFIGRQQVADDCTMMATCDFAWLAFQAHCQSTKAHAYSTPTDEDLATVRASVSWANGLTEEQLSSSDYLRNVAAIAARPELQRHQIGLAASIVQTYLREQRRKAEEAKPIRSTHVGTLGERTEFKGLKCTKVSAQHHARGITHLHRFIDPMENVISWFSSNTRLEEGVCYDLLCTVKKHDVFKGVPQTTVTRAKVLNQT